MKVFLCIILTFLTSLQVLPLKANLAVQEAKYTGAMNDLNKAQGQLDEKQRELDAVQALYDAAMAEKQVSAIPGEKPNYYDNIDIQATQETWICLLQVEFTNYLICFHFMQPISSKILKSNGCKLEGLYCLNVAYWLETLAVMLIVLSEDYVYDSGPDIVCLFSSIDMWGAEV